MRGELIVFEEDKSEELKSMIWENNIESIAFNPTRGTVLQNIIFN